MLDYENYTEELEKEISTTFRCRNCNYCYSRCPLYKSMEGFMVNGPSGIIQGLYYYSKMALNDKKSSKELMDIVFSCTTCNSCVMACEELSAGIPLLEIIENGRKLLVDQNVGPFPSQGNALKSMMQKGNPYNFDPKDRLNWLGDLQVKRIPHQKSDTLLYIGCTTSYDPEIQMVARCLVKILQDAKVDFAILADEVCCAGDALIMGDEFLFNDIMENNVNNFSSNGIKKIIVISPHCYDTFVHKYQNLDNVEIEHYTKFLYQLSLNHNLEFKKDLNYTVTYHDPCYLGKHNGIYQEPRELLSIIPGVSLVEMKDNRKMSLCCGGGGGRMWTDIKEEKRLANQRIEQAIDTGANVLAVACPWCHSMLLNAVKDLQKEDTIKVLDIAELLAEGLAL